MHPGFFQEESIRSHPEEETFCEMVLDLRNTPPLSIPLPVPSGISFAEYRGPLNPLHEAVRKVDEDWVQYFNENDRFFCAFDGSRIVAFCMLDDMGRFQGLKIAGPGCVGTIPEYREKGIALEMVRRATEILREEGWDISWIHYTWLEYWYGKLGYRTVLKWNSRGFLPDTNQSDTIQGGMQMDSIYHRISVRKYLNKPVEKEKTEAILRAAMQAPSAGNQQPWEFYVVTNKDKLKELSEISPYAKMTKDAPAAIVAAYRKECWMPQFAQIDLSIAMENLWLETDAQGLGGVWLGIAPVEDRMEALEKIMDMPDTLRAFAIFPYGYPAESRPQQDRYDESRIHWID